MLLAILYARQNYGAKNKNQSFGTLPFFFYNEVNLDKFVRTEDMMKKKVMLKP
jgi:hypothetical protein